MKARRNKSNYTHKISTAIFIYDSYRNKHELFSHFIVITTLHRHVAMFEVKFPYFARKRTTK